MDLAVKQIPESIEVRTKGHCSPPIDILPIELLIHIFKLVRHQPSWGLPLAQIPRSKDLPLTITFRSESTRAGNMTVWGEQTLPLFHLISNEWQRWEYINLFIPYEFCTLRMRDFDGKEMPCLRMEKFWGLRIHPDPISCRTRRTCASCVSAGRSFCRS
jgi:hypothetical protein